MAGGPADSVRRIGSTSRTSVSVARSAMLGICTFSGCTTIVFGRGTCVEHDGRLVSVPRATLIDDAGSLAGPARRSA
jgi:hypothetical protein